MMNKAKVMEVLKRIEWVGEPPLCPWCTRWRWHSEGHRDDCKLAALLDEAKGGKTLATKMRPCNEDCNHCPIICHPNSRLLTKVLNELLDRFGNGVYEIVQGHCPNLTVCYDCRIDDFCHEEGCELVNAESEKGVGMPGDEAQMTCIRSRKEENLMGLEIVSKQKIMERLAEELRDSLLWSGIAILLNERQELRNLQWLYADDAWMLSKLHHAKRLRELEERFGV